MSVYRDTRTEVVISPDETDVNVKLARRNLAIAYNQKTRELAT